MNASSVSFMARTNTEQNIVHDRNAKGVLVPLIQELMKDNVGVDTPEDAEFMHALMMKGVVREQERTTKMLRFSPSALASCMRKVYLSRNYKVHEIEKVRIIRPSANSIFLNGDFLHLKWQFVIYKLAQKMPDRVRILELDDLEPRGFEVAVSGRTGDHGGTLDIAVAVDEVPYIVDAKGINVRAFQKISRSGETPGDYRIQLADYLMLVNSDKKLALDFKIEDGLLLVENKGGADYHHPLAISEIHVSMTENLPEVKARLGVLREAEKKGEIPKPECTSVHGFQFTGCPFNGFCKKEVKEIAKRAKAVDNRNAAKFSIAVPKGRGTNRSRKPRS